MRFHKFSSKIKLVHLLSDINHPREIASVQSLKALEKEGIEYSQMINPKFIGITPRENCLTPDRILDDLDSGKYAKNNGHMGPGTWGCFQAHKRAVCDGFSTNFDYLLVCECDCCLTVPTRRFVEAVNVWGRRMIQQNMWALFIGGFSGFEAVGRGVYRYDFFFSAQSVDAHCVLYPMSTLKNIINLFETEKWWPFDLWLSRLLRDKLAITKAKFAAQIEGKSLIDGEMKGIDTRRLPLETKMV